MNTEPLIFYKAIEKWMQEFDENSASIVESRARIIVRLVTDEDALFPVNLSAGVVQTLRRCLGLDATGGSTNVDKDLFRSAEEEICTIMRDGPFVRFLGSKQYRDVLKQQRRQVKPVTTTTSSN